MANSIKASSKITDKPHKLPKNSNAVLKGKGAKPKGKKGQH